MLGYSEDDYPIVLIPPIIKDFLSTERCAVVPAPSIEAESCQDLLGRGSPPLLTLRRKVFYLLAFFLLGVILALFTQFPKILLVIAGIVAILGGIALEALKYSQISSENDIVETKQLFNHSVEELQVENLLGLKPDEDRTTTKERQQKLRQLLEGQVTQPTGISTAQQGVSEADFGKFLNVYFGELVQQGEELSIPNTEYRYSTDFSLVFQELRLDIEIDEPYEGRSKQPHHCCDDPKDTNRNQFFVDANWIVIRFSEQQAVYYPKSCCKVIAKVIEEITGEERYLARCRDLADLKPQRRWNTAHARQLAKWDYRLKYLKEAGIYLRKPVQIKPKNKRKKRKKY